MTPKAELIAASAMAQEGLWANAQDSIRHALEHFSELAGSRDDEAAHHRKWALLSVHHAAECFCNMLLLSFRPDDPPFSPVAGAHFPSLTRSLSLLGCEGNLSPGERRLVWILQELSKARNEIMHKMLPGDLEMSAAAISLLGILRVAKRRLGVETSDIVDQTPSIESSVFAAIRYKRIEEYCQFAEGLLREEYAGRELEVCPNCVTHSVIYSRCEVCYEEMSRITCDVCDEDYPVPSWELGLNTGMEISCPNCGHTFRANSGR